MNEMEAKIHKLIEDSVELLEGGNLESALQKAKESGKKERQYVKYGEENSFSSNISLTCAVWFHLALTYEKNGLLDEAIHAYSFLVKKKQISSPEIIRINMGNAYYNKGQYNDAIKMYRMALDLIPQSKKQLGYKVCSNIGNTFVKMGDFRRALQSLNEVVTNGPDTRSSLNLILCLHYVGRFEEALQVFRKMLESPILDDINKCSTEEKKCDDDQTSRYAFTEGERLISTAAELILSVRNNDCNIPNKFEWVCSQLLSNQHDRIEGTLRLLNANKFLLNGNIDQATTALNEILARKSQPRDSVCTNLSVLSFLNGDMKSAKKHANAAFEINRYNSNVLVGRGNLLFTAGEFQDAKEAFVEAIGVKADCVEAIYNLGLANLRLDLPRDALRAFEKLHSLLPNNAQVYFQIANLYEVHNDVDEALKWYNVLIARHPNDPGILSKISKIYNEFQDLPQSVHYQVESVRRFPDVNVIIWLGSWYAKNKYFEQSFVYFELASQIQPKEIKWMLMVANLHKKLGRENNAYEMLIEVHDNFPDDTDCMRYLIEICKELDKPCLPGLEERYRDVQTSKDSRTVVDNSSCEEKSNVCLLRNRRWRETQERPDSQQSKGSSISSVSFNDTDIKELLG